jgi:FkbM family methyltransferase
MHIFKRFKRWNVLINSFSWYERIFFIIAGINYRIRKIIPPNFEEERNVKEWLFNDGFNIEKVGKVINVSNSSTFFSLRQNTSDFAVASQIFVFKQFNPVVNIVQKGGLNVESIVDAGANIGLTSIYFRQYFPNAQYILIEPNAENVALTYENISRNNFQAIEILEMGLWHSVDSLFPFTDFGDGRHWAFSLTEERNEGTEIQTIDLDTLITDFHLEVIDILKIDIEGAEDLIFLNSSDCEFLSNCNTVTIEIHDTSKIERYANIFKDHGFHWFVSGELFIAFRSKWVVKSKS